MENLNSVEGRIVFGIAEIYENILIDLLIRSDRMREMKILK